MMEKKWFTVTGTVTKTAWWSIKAETEEEARALVEEHGMNPEPDPLAETTDWHVISVEEDA